jgi:hypothetical protein
MYSCQWIAAHRTLHVQETSHGNKSQIEGSQWSQASLQAQQTASSHSPSHRSGEITSRVTSPLTHSLSFTSRSTSRRCRLHSDQTCSHRRACTHHTPHQESKITQTPPTSNTATFRTLTKPITNNKALPSTSTMAPQWSTDEDRALLLAFVQVTAPNGPSKNQMEAVIKAVNGRWTLGAAT